MQTLIQQLVNGLVLGSMYALVALGYTMVYGIVNLINFAHGDVMMVGALTSYSMFRFLHAVTPGMPWPLVLAIALVTAMAVCGTLNFFIERLAYRRLRNAPKLAPLVTAIGMSILLETLAMVVWGRDYKVFPEMFPNRVINMDGVVITQVQIAILVVTVLLLVGLTVLINHTRLGRAMRATAENPRVASLMGVNPNLVISAAFVIGAVLAAIAGVMWYANFSTANFYMGFTPGLKAFTAAVLGGIGNMGGAMVGGVLLGVIEVLGAGYIGTVTHGMFGSNYQDIFAFIVLILVLTLRPQGLLGERVADRA
ncbi:MAG: branched-chain amino acid ABC transporter permease [Betaproteobacteria bacterium]|nr:branched-chain amino acid ABC transporter permease [Betaproteobacteria bacterium]MBU6513452.1 branched-chain amino acid ABC transporter permease [Betaproteobacteria bacterium]MDE2152798.1 branched-chain amino acid ABC transporter permease [Betaproteobacteria bacterium]